jgi:hypothetical protein
MQKKENGILLNYKWGAMHSNRGGNKDVIAKTEEEASRYINAMLKRRKYRGYDLIRIL